LTSVKTVSGVDMADTKFTTTLLTSAPALPVINEDPTAGFQNNYSNILRLYFNQIDNFSSGLNGPTGGRFLDFPHISASDSTNQYAPANDTPTLVKWNTAVAVNGFTLNTNNTATAQISGIYKIDYSLQVVNNANAIHEMFVWLQVNGSQLANSSSRFTLAARKSGSVFTFIVAYSSVVFEAEAGDDIGLYWATDLAAQASPAVDGVFLNALPVQTTPYARPASPSAIGSITFLGRP
jgi:hypothetical protein